ncbi:hypothetical protein BJ508DRAFT_315759 [Ascobolus immersus RN42]|uniref:Uncharacterized protein n=1 Tax=Ascobolus immersus RN42 TaxID=1160509 RepID=A0A3N4HGV4_ASCIM|nr:hypothetical protein BJ508DRAFT_315759 [Ascobolus immersus RN42]
MGYPSGMFVPVDESMKARVPSNQGPPPDICAHNFKAAAAKAEKPHSMAKCDETGLFALVCRHDIPLKLMNNYVGERFEYVILILKAFLEVAKVEMDLVDTDIETILTYDVACRLSPFIKRNHPELARLVTVVVNKFHGIAHELRCQVLYGAISHTHLGNTDGEGVGRFWSFLKWLVAAGRESTPENRTLFIEDHSYFQTGRKYLKFGMSLYERYKTAKLLSEKHSARLKTVLGQKLSLKDVSGSVFTVVVDEARLQVEIKSQKEYFASQKSRKVKSVNNIFLARWEEEAIKTRIKAANERFRSGEIDAREHTRLVRQAGNLKEKEAATEVLLKKHKHVRDQWVVGGAMWEAAVKKLDPNRTIYAAILMEEEAERQKGNLSKSGHNLKMRKLRENTHNLMDALKQKPIDWKSGGRLYTRFKCEAIIEQLEDIYAQLLSESAARALQLRNLKARIRGSNKKAAQAFKIVRKFNDLAQTIPAPFTPPLLQKSAFYDKDELLTAPETDETDALWKLEMLRSELCNFGASAPKEVGWPYSAAIRFGIDAFHRTSRAFEEMELIQIEWCRLVQFTSRRTEILLACHKNPSPAIRTQYNLDIFLGLLWDEIRALQSLIKASDLFQRDYPTWIKEEVRKLNEFDENELTQMKALYSECLEKVKQNHQFIEAGFEANEFDGIERETDDIQRDVRDGYMSDAEDSDGEWEELDDEATTEAFDRLPPEED